MSLEIKVGMSWRGKEKGMGSVCGVGGEAEEQAPGVSQGQAGRRPEQMGRGCRLQLQ